MCISICDKSYDVFYKRLNKVVNKWIQDGRLKDIYIDENCTIVAKTDDSTTWCDMINQSW